MLKKLEKDRFDSVFELMKISFPKEEYRPYEKQVELFESGAYDIYFLPDEQQESAIKAFISVWDMGDFAYIEHFAVNPVYRNGGLGSLMITELVKTVGKMICLEVEPPEDEVTRSRIEFYEANGFYLNEYPYIQPPFAEGYDELPLMIMTSYRNIIEPEFEEIRDILYKKVYFV